MSVFESLLTWLDAAPWRFWTVAWGCFAALVFTAARSPDRAPGRAGRIWFACAIFATLAAFRWPAWFKPEEFNPDESLVIAGALTLKRYLLFWEYVDGGTHGPIPEYILTVAGWLGAPLNHATARIAAIGLEGLTLVAIWRTLAALASERIARLAILPGVAFWAFISWVDFIHYGTELPGIALIAVGLWALAAPLVAAADTRGTRLRLGFGGCALGLVPLSKLQLVPLAGLAGLVALAVLGDRWRQGNAAARRGIAALLAGAVLPTVLLLIYLLVFGLTGQFWRAYIVSAMGYSSAGHHPFAEMPSWFFHFSATAFGFAWFFWGTLAFALLYARAACPPSLRFARGAAWFAVAVAMFCVLWPSREVAHYLHIMVLPLTLLGGIVLAGALAEAGASRWDRLAPVAAFAAIAILPQVHYRAVSWHPDVGCARDYLATPRAAAADYIVQRAQPGDRMAMWGWEPALFVQTGLPQGTRSGATVYELTQWPLRDFYVERYRQDLLARRPAWFVDAVGPGAFVFEDRGNFAHETIAAIREVIERDYELETEIAGKRIYRLKASRPPAGG